jgi:CRISPR-associated endonuclease Cas2
MAKKGEIAKDILSILAAAGLVVVALTLPNALSAFRFNHNKYSKRQVYNSLRNLKAKKLVSIGTGKEGDKTVVKLTKLGKEKVLKYKFDDLKIQKQTKWDKRWRIVIFDVPEDFKNNRTIFAKKLKDMGFKSLQKSVWVCPYPCEDEIDFITELYEISRYVRLVTAEQISFQEDLMEKFKLF